MLRRLRRLEGRGRDVKGWRGGGGGMLRAGRLGGGIVLGADMEEKVGLC